MKNDNLLCLYVLLIFLFSLISCHDGEKVDSVVYDRRQDSANDRFDRLFEAMECDDKDLDISKFEGSIDSLLFALVDRLQKSGNYSTMVNPLVDLIQLERKSYQSSAIQESELVFWSYGVTAMNGERVVTLDCFYYRALQRKWQLYLAIEDKIEGALLGL
jgi:hypothetical protein